MGDAYRRFGPPAVVMFLLLAGCAATGPPAVVPELEPIVVDARALPVPTPTERVVEPAPPRPPPRADIALVVDTSSLAHAAVADEIAAALADARLVAPAVPVVANVTARPEQDPETIRRLLVEQVTGRVRWRESMEWMTGEGGAARFAEIGSGKVLTGMAKRIAPDAESLSLNTPEDLEAFAKSLA